MTVSPVSDKRHDRPAILQTCPWWCELPAGHQATEEDPGTSYRTHRTTVATGVTVEQDEADGRLDKAAWVWIAWPEGEQTELSAERAEAHAAALSAAAELVRSICR